MTLNDGVTAVVPFLALKPQYSTREAKAPLIKTLNEAIRDPNTGKYCCKLYGIGSEWCNS